MESVWQRKVFGRETPPRAKPLLYVFHALLTGIHLMRTGEVEANILRLDETAGLSYIDELVDRKSNGPEKEALNATDRTFTRANTNG